jgi:hypothetical protein
MKEKKTGIAAAAAISGSLSILLIGILFVLAEGNDFVHDFLEFFPQLGALSGNIIISYSSGLVLFLVLGKVLKNRNPGMLGVLTLSAIILLLATLFSYTPFIKMII